jgi:UDP-N-acetylmuramoylalanine--D-glutamate ligase
VQQALRLGKPVFSEVEVASWFCPAPIVAVTGSNGKTTTSSLVAHVFQTSGKEVVLGGNIGYPFSDFVTNVSASGTVVLELSSFQLDHIDRFRPRVAVLLNITADHLDRYVSFERYAESKFRIMENQRRGDTVIYNHDDALINNHVSSTADRLGPRRLPFGQEARPGDGAFVREDHLVIRLNQKEEVVMPTSELALRGRHNVYNSLAAAAAARAMEIRSDVIRESLMTFEGIPHRLEFIIEVDGARYVNDSKATNINSVWYALESFNAPIVWIAGGRDKGNDYTPLKALVEEKVRALVAIGEGSDKLITELGPLAGASVKASSLEEAVEAAHQFARSGDVVLLSPACASFDMFRDFEDRGDQFRSIVHNLARH